MQVSKQTKTERLDNFIYLFSYHVESLELKPFLQNSVSHAIQYFQTCLFANTDACRINCVARRACSQERREREDFEKDLMSEKNLTFYKEVNSSYVFLSVSTKPRPEFVYATVQLNLPGVESV